MTGRARTGQGRSAPQGITGSELQLLDSLIPALYAAATGKPLKEGDPIPKTDPAAVDRLLKVLELRLKYRALGETKRTKRPAAWAPAQNGDQS